MSGSIALAMLGFIDGPGEWTKLLFSVFTLGLGVGVAIIYMRRPATDQMAEGASFGGKRPWRRLGAAICLLLSVVFVLGVYLLDEDTRPGVYMVYWLVIMVLVVWLCWLAFADIMYTRRALLTLKKKADETPGLSSTISSAGEEPKP